MQNRQELIEVMAHTLCHEYGEALEDGRASARAVLTAIEAAGAVVVPKVATEEMKRAAWAEHKSIDESTTPFDFRGADVTHHTYIAMIAASPFRS